MAMKSKITINKVQGMLAEIRKGVAKFGPQYSPAYSTLDLSEALLVLAEQVRFQPDFTKEDYNKLSRQLAACTSREKGLRGKLMNTHALPPLDVENSEETGS